MSTHDAHDIHSLTGAHAAGALPDEERRPFEAHLDECPSCRLEVDGLVATAARLGAAVAAPAPPAMRDRVLSEIVMVRQVSPVVTHLHLRQDAPWFRRPLGIAASLLLVLTIGAGGFAATERQRADDAERTAARIIAVVTDPGRGQATRSISSGGEGMVITAGGDAVFRASGLATLPSDRAYQLWRLDKSGAHSLGVLGRGTGGSVDQFIEDVNPTDQLGLTVEPKEGSPRPTTTPVILLPVPA
jgi:anti-sigma-K factor RskA